MAPPVAGPSLIIAAPLGIVFLDNLAASSAPSAGAGGLVGHFWHNIPKGVASQMGNLLEAGDSGPVIVAVNPRGAHIGALLTNADNKIIENNASDLDGALEPEFEQADA